MLITWITVIGLVWAALQGLAGALVLGNILERALNG